MLIIKPCRNRTSCQVHAVHIFDFGYIGELESDHCALNNLLIRFNGQVIRIKTDNDRTFVE
jgi:hypothetical protein